MVLLMLLLMLLVELSTLLPMLLAMLLILLEVLSLVSLVISMILLAVQPMLLFKLALSKILNHLKNFNFLIIRFKNIFFSSYPLTSREELQTLNFACKAACGGVCNGCSTITIFLPLLFLILFFFMK